MKQANLAVREARQKSDDPDSQMNRLTAWPVICRHGDLEMPPGDDVVSDEPRELRSPSGAPGQPRHKPSLLIADDDPQMRRLLSAILGAWVTAFARNGVEAVSVALEAWRNGCSFDVVLMDIDMPVMDGQQAMETLRRLGYRHPIVAHTATTTEVTLDSRGVAGFNAMVRKGTQPEHLRSAVGDYLVQ